MDGGPVSNRGLKEAMKLARAGNARVRLFHVIAEYAAFANAEAAIDIRPILAALRLKPRGARAALDWRARSWGGCVEISLADSLNGSVADTIVDEARRWRADLIVMGTHGRRGVKRMLLGSEAESVVRCSPMPVLLVPRARR